MAFVEVPAGEVLVGALRMEQAAHRLAEALGVTEHKTGIKVERS